MDHGTRTLFVTKLKIHLNNMLINQSEQISLPNAVILHKALARYPFEAVTAIIHFVIASLKELALKPSQDHVPLLLVDVFTNIVRPPLALVL